MRWQSKIGYGSMYACFGGSETESLNNFDLKRKSVKRQHCYIETSDSEHENDSECSQASSSLIPQNWDSLNSNLQTVLPSDDKFTYVVEDYQPKHSETFPGAPVFAFNCQVRIVWHTKQNVTANTNASN